MKIPSLTLATLLIPLGCSNKPEPINSEPSPAVEINIPKPAAMVQSAPDAELEAAIRAASPDYRADVIGAGGKARYAAARMDLNADGNEEVFVYLMGPFFCGTGGCNLLVFSQGMDGYSLLADIPTSDPPVIISGQGTGGYADFWRMQSGGGGPSEYVRHVFESGRYVEKSRAAASAKPGGNEILPADLDFADGTPLDPGN
jgi:hypothetical protein